MFKYPFLYPTLTFTEMDSVPGPPTALTRDEEKTDMTQATFSWKAPESDGNSTIRHYKVTYQNNTDEPVMLFSTELSVTIAITGPYKL
jgi:hypothetical protein